MLEASEPSPYRIAVPAHRALRVGALNSILRAVSRHKRAVAKRLSTGFEVHPVGLAGWGLGGKWR